ncbi:MAG: 1-acyl-sn-glycerol-3-phosphate acyltransferase [Gammaproteobacteria bacterium]|nr:1-acyl-sn-glycerol-3-phosphate acyltransferase [Gammaproteobacteria bacterium]
MIISLRRVVKLLLLVLHLLFGLLQTLLLSLRAIPSYHPLYRRAVRRWMQQLCAIFALQIYIQRQDVACGSTKSRVVVANHISWLDIPVIAAVENVVFLSKAEVRRWPLIGWLAARSGTRFIARGVQGAAMAAERELQQALAEGVSPLFFPEGTTSDGKQVRRFLRPLFNSAISAQVAVQPLALRYLQNGRAHPTVPYIGDQTLWHNLWQLLGEPSVEVEVTLLPYIDDCRDNRELARRAQLAIARVVTPDGHE